MYVNFSDQCNYKVSLITEQLRYNLYFNILNERNEKKTCKPLKYLTIGSESIV